MAALRTVGALDDARGLGVHDHACWGFDDIGEFTSRAVEFLLDGLDLGQQVWFFGEGDPEVLAHLAERGGGDGAVHIEPLSTAWPVGEVVDPLEQAQARGRALQDALDAGFAGLRLAADATPMVETPAQLDAWVRFESIAEWFMAEPHPFAALCGYHRRRLGEDAVAQLACMHPNARDGTAPFRLHGIPDPTAAAALSGELDLRSRDWFPRALDRAGWTPMPGRTVVDASHLGFADHASLTQLAEWARSNDTVVVLRDARPTLARVVELLRLPGVVTEPVS
ncbi:MEDS domain-containing protein [Segeticoccus sp.]|uniref:MEDS domain-containing protein n=1 Tax=Segeticoccus sp. TaxID=2706531 RepID=UPI002D7EB93D|nr:MEDS domain-containing protein [Segeticoccus sp.]